MNQGRFHLFDLFGVSVFANITFLIPLIFSFTSYRNIGNPSLMFALGVFAALGFFLAILLHEAGHMLMARRFGIATRSIEIHGLGGIAILARSARTRLQSILISLAGPAVNLALYLTAKAALAGLDLYDAQLEASGGTPLPDGPYIALLSFGWLNLILLVFNLFPAFPLDGGNVARQVLSWFMRDALAIRIIAICGVLAGVGMIFLAQQFGLTLLFLAAILILENWRIYQSAR